MLHSHEECTLRKLACRISNKVTDRPVTCNLSHLCRTAISFSMLFSLPSNAFFGIHLMATNLWVLFSSARTTSENAPLKHKHRGQTICLQLPNKAVKEGEMKKVVSYPTSERP